VPAARKRGRDLPWPESLDTLALISDGWRPRPFQSFVLKIHSRCDLRCDYCYMYEMADQSWRSRPRVMSRATIDVAATRIAEHVAAHKLRDIELILHGGEPLLAGPELISYAVETIRAAVGNRAHVHACMQTNGARLNREVLRLLDGLQVTVGVSLDGDQAMHDRHRRRRDGAGSYAAVAAALAELAQYPGLFSGLICVVDVRNDPVATYEALLRFGPPTIDFQLPHGNWSAPPPSRPRDDQAAPYGDWLIALFDRWYRAPGKETRVRLFEEIVNLLLGGSSRTEAIGISPVTVVVVETGGDIEQSDMLKSAYHGAAQTGLHLTRDSFDTVLLRPGTAARQLGMRALAPACRACPVGRVCGGGLYPHRYQAGTGFANPSVYCADLYRLIGHIRDQLAHDLAALRAAAPCP
jgi:uncharacterized protein